MLSIDLLARLVKMNYKLRAQRILPDRWYWADKMLMELGYCIDITGKLKTISTKSKYQTIQMAFGLKHKKSFSEHISGYFCDERYS